MMPLDGQNLDEAGEEDDIPWDCDRCYPIDGCGLMEDEDDD